jgi:cob(I)alamin adenosyltransferase
MTEERSLYTNNVIPLWAFINNPFNFNAIRKMKIYTKTGDDGMTSLYGGTRLPKHDIRIEAYGTVDELNSWLGLIRDELSLGSQYHALKEIQDRLFTIGAHLASDPDKQMPKPDISMHDIDFLEKGIDEMSEKLPPLRHFVLPGGHRRVSETHIARTVCRRAERRVTALNSVYSIEPLIVTYLNRLSDYLFVLSRWIAKEVDADEVKWIPRKA